jgi:hypothetical protein
MDTIPERFSRAAGQAPRATVAAYAMAVLHAAIALTVGLIGGTAYTIAIGVAAAVVGAVLLSRRPKDLQPIPEPESMTEMGDDPLTMTTGEAAH